MFEHSDSFVDTVCNRICELHLNVSMSNNAQLLMNFPSSHLYAQCIKKIDCLEKRWFEYNNLKDLNVTHFEQELMDSNCLVSPDLNIPSTSSFNGFKIKQELDDEFEEFEKFYTTIVHIEEPNKVITPDDRTPCKVNLEKDQMEMLSFSFAKIKSEVGDESTVSQVVINKIVCPRETSGKVCFTKEEEIICRTKSNGIGCHTKTVATVHPFKSTKPVFHTSTTETKNKKRLCPNPPPPDWPYKRFKVPYSASWRIQCALCELEISFSHKKKHSLKHVPENTDIKWLFRCLVCSESSCVQSLYFDTVVEKHIPKKHFIKIPQLGVHYVNKNDEYKEDILAVYRLCFPY